MYQRPRHLGVLPHLLSVCSEQELHLDLSCDFVFDTKMWQPQDVSLDAINQKHDSITDPVLISREESGPPIIWLLKTVSLSLSPHYWCCVLLCLGYIPMGTYKWISVLKAIWNSYFLCCKPTTETQLRSFASFNYCWRWLLNAILFYNCIKYLDETKVMSSKHGKFSNSSFFVTYILLNFMIILLIMLQFSTVSLMKANMYIHLLYIVPFLSSC